ncbi:adenylyl-sulfate kinase [Altericista sp. CCNU0014]|uniref:adenylyl-sulfate kinase n=1 Tax=Altericista sp. CCNU0014 TaxID=3082949 RepID=UPI00384C91C5
MQSTNVVWHHATVSREEREVLNSHKSAILWFTGLSGAGKSTLSHAVESRLHEMKCHTFVIDGDNVRHGLCGDLGFAAADRTENIRRVGEVAKLFVEAGVITLTAFISPFRSDRDRVRQMVGANEFFEIYCKADLAVCEQRDVKGMYRKARSGEIAEFTGISSPYEAPEAPELVVETGSKPLEACVEEVIDLLMRQGIIKLDLTKSVSIA